MIASEPAPRTACAPIGLSAVAGFLGSCRVRLTNEQQMQADLHQLLIGAFGEDQVRREVRLSSRDRPDFMVGDGVAVELKQFRARPASILRQLKRYAEHEAVSGLVLLTGRAVGFPAQVDGKPLVVIGTGAAWL